MTSTRVAVLSDDRLYCEGIERILGPCGGFAALLAGTMGELVDALHGAAPHVALVDSHLAQPFSLCRSLRPSFDGALLLVAAPEDDAWTAQALDAGANGVVGRGARAEELRQAVLVVRAGGLWVRRVAASAALRSRASQATQPGREPAAGSRLSSREREVFRHAAMGLANKELADRLAISEATVKVHLSRIFQKLGVHGRGELAAAYHGLIVTGTERPSLGS